MTDTYLLNFEKIFFLKILCFLERGEGKEKERERNIGVWELINWLTYQLVNQLTSLIGCLAHAPNLRQTLSAAKIKQG